jgi:hypothetical protein
MKKTIMMLLVMSLSIFAWADDGDDSASELAPQNLKEGNKDITQDDSIPELPPN